MKPFLKNSLIIGVSLSIGAVSALTAYTYFQPLNAIDSSLAEMAIDEPLYWVAPMDPNYRRDKPGQSPMGMDLIPVYANEANQDSGAGTVQISPEVINSLGVRTGVASLNRLNLNVSTVGYVQYDQDKIQHLHPRVEGWIEEAYIKASGEKITQGQPLYRLYSPALVNAQEEYLFALGRKDKSLIKGAKERLLALNFPPTEIKRLTRTLKVQQSVTFFAPSDGVADYLNMVDGMFIKPGMELLSIASLDEVWVEAEVFEKQTSLIKEGLAVQMSLDYLPGKSWLGVVDYVYPTLDLASRTLRVRMRFDNQEQALKPNMFAKINILIDEAAPSLQVPKEAVIRVEQSNRVVLALGEGRFKSINVEIGRTDKDSIEIVSGLFEGDEVVTSALFLLDSESSKSSDFKRFNYPSSSVMDMSEMDHGSMDHSQMQMTSPMNMSEEGNKP
ncbi:cation efflux system protein CusB [Marinomonas sp. MED121]|uniref:efflux RND transporter periplasmic adaptor subunit n=1 Tax=Marinomonas sp. MED121 TaxID=314277 RepID=UPI000069042B|nr:efflux RND transporter periplasmic adaptor subunit [Marinomonas sp. MED121]EAQ66363.1 cation efflux system protein CusB [Marinomonas sp. MED121]